MYEARQNKEKVCRRIEAAGGTSVRLKFMDENKNTLKIPQIKNSIAQCFMRDGFRYLRNYTYDENGGQRHYSFGHYFIQNHLSNRNRQGFINTHFNRQDLIDELNSNEAIAYQSGIAPYNSMIEAIGTVRNDRQRVNLYMYYNHYRNDYLIAHCDQ